MEGLQERQFTRLMYSMATSSSLTLPQAVEQLRRDAHIRTLGETLAKYARTPGEDEKALQAFLTGRLMEHSPQGTKRDTVSRKVRMWLDGKIRSLSKEGAIQLCFALELSPEEADGFLHRTCGEGFHWRDPEEIVFLYALREGMTYPRAQALRDALAAEGLLAGGEDGGEGYTGLVRQEAERIASAEELRDYLREAQGRLGNLHNTAYALFREYLGLLQSPEINDLLEPEEKLSVREVTATYLHEALVPRVRQAARGRSEQQILSALQRDIQQNWPDETALSKMLHRKTDVTRKVLILLFLATDGAVQTAAGGEDIPEDGEDYDLEEAGFEDRYARINAMLSDCGFGPLDSRVPFDWMILYCMCIEESMFIDGQVEAFLEAVFPSESFGAG